MDNAIGAVVGIILGAALLLWALVRVAQIPAKVVGTMRGRDRCRFCGRKIRFDERAWRYAAVCAHCGQAQPWTVSVPAKW